MKQVKYYERLTIEAATEGSYQKARLALTIHPLIKDFSVATEILNEYISKHEGNFPDLR
jgi:alpha-galactosidase/6-phospho-beta-glucosidase family protein